MPVNQVVCGNNIEVVKSWPADCIDAHVTDPPYELGFMGKKWDTSGIAFSVSMWEAMLRITKPGGFLFCFGGTRTFHRLACAIEDAGWKIRDCMMWLYGSGFPKSYNIGQALEKRATIGKCRRPDRDLGNLTRNRWSGSEEGKLFANTGGQVPYTTEFGKLWEGYGTALKPAWEPIIIAMKPKEGSFANNAEKYGVAGLNIDGGRIQHNEPVKTTNRKPISGAVLNTKISNLSQEKNIVKSTKIIGRWPTNLILDEEAGRMLDEQSGTVSYGKKKGGYKYQGKNYKVEGFVKDCKPQAPSNYADSGGASRFFKQVEITIEDLIWNNTFVNYVEKLLWNIEAIIENSAQINVEDWQREKSDLIVKCVEKKLGLCEIYTVLVLARIKNLDSNQEILQVIQDSIGNYNECIQILNLVLSVANSENTDIIQTTINLLKSCGYVLPATKKCTQKTNQLGCSRFKYQPKTSKKERNLGLDDMPDKLYACSGGAQSAVKQGKDEYLQNHIGLNRVTKVKNNHPTVKPLALMKYLCTLLKMPNSNQIILDPFMGSGTTGMACKSLGINFIGIEKEQEYVEIARKRIAAI